MAYLTQFWISALLNPVINKIADEDNVLVLISTPFSLIKGRPRETVLFLPIVLMFPEVKSRGTSALEGKQN